MTIKKTFFPETLVLPKIFALKNEPHDISAIKLSHKSARRHSPGRRSTGFPIFLCRVYFGGLDAPYRVWPPVLFQGSDSRGPALDVIDFPHSVQDRTVVPMASQRESEIMSPGPPPHDKQTYSHLHPKFWTNENAFIQNAPGHVSIPPRPVSKHTQLFPKTLHFQCFVLFIVSTLVCERLDPPIAFPYSGLCCLLPRGS